MHIKKDGNLISIYANQSFSDMNACVAYIRQHKINVKREYNYMFNDHVVLTGGTLLGRLSCDY